jgi:hypothetical protein
MLRWQGLAEDLPDALQPTARLVDFEHIRDALPADVAVFTAEQRKAQIRARRAAIQGRFRG